MQRLQAPDVLPPAAEFRIYTLKGPVNSLRGNVISLTDDGVLSTLTTDLTWNGNTDALTGEILRVNGDFFPVVGNSAGSGCVIHVANLSAPALSPRPGPCSLTFTPGRGYWTDDSRQANWDQRLHVEPAVDLPFVRGVVQFIGAFNPDSRAVIARPGASRTVTTDQALFDAEGALTPGAMLCAGVVYPAYGHSLGNVLQVHILPQPGPAEARTLLEPAAGAEFVYYPGRRYEVRIASYPLLLAPGEGSAMAEVAVSCSDGQAYIPDDPRWSRRGTGELGGRPGNEGRLSVAATITAVKRSPPAAPANVPAAGAPIFAKPANFYGQAGYTLSWEAVAQTAGYAVYRCSGAALFDHDRRQRMNRKDFYATLVSEADVFADDPGFGAWLVGFDPSLSLHAMLSSVPDHLDAWRDWANHFYPALNDARIQELADRLGNEKSLQRVNRIPWPVQLTWIGLTGVGRVSTCTGCAPLTRRRTWAPGVRLIRRCMSSTSPHPLLPPLR